MTEINNKIPTWTADKLLLTLSLKHSWRYYEFEQEFGLTVNDLMDFTDLFCICDHQIHVYVDATTNDLELFANFLNQQEATNQTKTDSFSNWFTVFLEEKGLSNLVIEFENEQGWNYFPVQVIAEFLSSCPQDIQEQVRTNLAVLDFCSVDITHFLEHVAKGIAHF